MRSGWQGKEKKEKMVREYVSENPENCAVKDFACGTGDRFDDETGCGCEHPAPISDPAPDPVPPEGKLKAIDCTPEQRNAEVCTAEYNPVCGWNDPAKIQCIRYPCATTYSNSCVACQNPNVISWTEGECPK